MLVPGRCSASVMELLAVVFPHRAAVRSERAYQMGAIVPAKAATTVPKYSCPGCECESVRFHRRYERCLADLPVAGQEVLLQERVRRFFCNNLACGRRTFAEQVPGLTSRHGRRAAGSLSMALALGGRPGPVIPPGWPVRWVVRRCCGCCGACRIRR